MNQLSEFVKNKRLDQGYTQQDYAVILGISKPTLFKIENGQMIGLQTLKKLSLYYGVSIKLLRRMMILENN